ncbi:Proteasome assembly chaperone 1 [Bienertia sinuspersici]
MNNLGGMVVICKSGKEERQVGRRKRSGRYLWLDNSPDPKNQRQYQLLVSMDDVVTDIPPPSRFFEEDLNIFTPPSPSLPTPFVVLSDPFANETLRPSFLIFAMSSPSLHIFHHVSSKKLIGTLVLPEIPFSGNTIAPSLNNKSCNIYALNDTEKLVLLVCVQFHVPAERCHAVSKLLLCEKIVPERVLVLDSIQIQKFRGRLSRDDTVVYKLATSSQRKGFGESPRGPSLLKDMEYYPSGSVVDGLAAALLARCQIRDIQGSLCISWPEFGKPVMHLIRSLLMKDVLPDFDFSSTNYEDESLKSNWLKNPLLDAELYT